LGEHLRLLKQAGFSGVSLEEAVAMPETERRARRPVALTFDDGFRDFYTNAWPLLMEAECSATMYLPTAFIGWPRKSFRGRECLTWDEVREIRRSGIRFGSHTVNHLRLYDLPWREIARETLYSKRKIESELDEEVSSIAYPYAFPQEDGVFVGHLADVLQRQGYRSCATTLIGRHKSNGKKDVFVSRLPANSSDDSALLNAKLRGHYDWMAMAQRLVRQCRRKERLCLTAGA
jgi:peptidoglycan/xylan/chitin deacetylase (PgdA/CDA1 family)